MYNCGVVIFPQVIVWLFNFKLLHSSDMKMDEIPFTTISLVQ